MIMIMNNDNNDNNDNMHNSNEHNPQAPAERLRLAAGGEPVRLRRGPAR